MGVDKAARNALGGIMQVGTDFTPLLDPPPQGGRKKMRALPDCPDRVSCGGRRDRATWTSRAAARRLGLDA